MTILMENETNQESPFAFDYEELAKQVIEAALDAEEFPYEAEVSILLVTKQEIQEINALQRNMDRPTDVLSFPMITYDEPGDFSKLELDDSYFHPDTGEALLGDIVLCLDLVKEQAQNYGHSEKREFCFLIVHSILHLLGYDHMTEEEAAIMEGKQEAILQSMNILR